MTGDREIQRSAYGRYPVGDPAGHVIHQIPLPELRELVARRLEHENVFTDHRVNWLLAIYAAAGLGVGFLWERELRGGWVLLTMLCAVGFFASVSVLVTSSHARGVRHLVREALNLAPTDPGQRGDPNAAVPVDGELLAALLGGGVERGYWQGLLRRNRSRPFQPWWGFPLSGVFGWPLVLLVYAVAA